MATALENSSVPTAVRRQAEKAEADFKASQQQPTVAIEETPEPKPDVKPAEPVKQPEPEPNEDYVRLEHRFRVLEGKYRKEVPALHEAVKSKDTEIEALKGRLQQMAQQTPQDPKDRWGLTDSEAEYGDEMLSATEKVARGVVGDELKAILAKFDEMEARISSTTTQHGQTSPSADFLRDLSRFSPKWRELNNSPEFLDWLDAYDPMLGDQRVESFNKAVGDEDAERVSAFFKAYDSQQNTTTTAAKTPDIESQVMPETTASTVTKPAAKKWSQAEILKTYSDITRGRYTKAEGDKLRAEIDAAVTAGNILP